ncbi:hypothetical protein R3P38DRAFT_2892121 [Favolaschia claudopus]|uniref:F-box domain-containing protein n=1 Tax=Favolaschia claudopus TaxID=2862362 RepID=A0AAW0CW07_9AGAR
MDRSPRRALDIVEIIDCCLAFVDPSSGDLTSCALVARPWLHPSQSRLFRVPHLTNILVSFEDRTVLKFHDSLFRNPHLLPFVRELSFIFVLHLSPDIFTKICRLDFPNLDSFLVVPTDQRLWDGLRQLASTKTIRYFCLDYMQEPNSSFMFPASMSGLSNCSRAIEHLDLFVTRWSLEGYIPNPTAPIYLTSIRLGLQWSCFTPTPFTLSAFYPFNLSKLRAISVTGQGSFPWNSLPKGRLELLSFTPGKHQEEITDLSLLPKLSILRTSTDPSIDLLPISRLLATMKSGHQIHTIILFLNHTESLKMQYPGWDKLDLALTSLACPAPAIELEFHEAAIPCMKTLSGLLPKVLSQTTSKVQMFLCSHQREQRWWKEQVQKL